MNTMKSAGFLRIWKVILFIMATIMFAVCFGNTAWAAYGRIFFMDETGHVITKDQIADKTIEITYKTNGHSEGSDPEDHGKDYVWHDTVYHYPYTEGFKKTVPRSSTSYIGYKPYDWCETYCYDSYQFTKVSQTDSHLYGSFNIFDRRSAFMNSVVQDVINYYKNGGIDKYVTQVAAAKRAADAYANQINYSYEHNQKYNGKYVDYYDMKGAKELAEDYYYELENVKKAQANKANYIDTLQRYIDWNWPKKITVDYEEYSVTTYSLYMAYNKYIQPAFQNALAYAFSAGHGVGCNSWSSDPYNITIKVNGTTVSTNASLTYWFWSKQPYNSSYEPQDYSFIRAAGISHTHNSKGIDYNQGNDNQHIKYTYCNSHGSDHSQNRSNGTWENHTWIHVNATTDKCSACGKTRTRYYYDPGQSGDSGIYVNVSVMSPTGVEDQKSGYFQLSRDGVNWSSETTDQIMSYVQSFKYNDKLYVRYTRPYYDYYELDSVTYKLPMAKINDNTWCYTVQSESPRQEIRLNMKYKPFDVHYILSGGSLPNKKDTYIITDTFTIGEPSLSGYTFTGWTMTCSKGKANDRSFIPCNILVPTKDVTISNMYGDITLTANYEKSGTNDDNGHNKTPDDNGSPDHITDTGDRKTPLVTDSNSKHNMFRVTK